MTTCGKTFAPNSSIAMIESASGVRLLIAQVHLARRAVDARSRHVAAPHLGVPTDGPDVRRKCLALAIPQNSPATEAPSPWRLGGSITLANCAFSGPMWVATDTKNYCDLDHPHDSVDCISALRSGCLSAFRCQQSPFFAPPFRQRRTMRASILRETPPQHVSRLVCSAATEQLQPAFVRLGT